LQSACYPVSWHLQGCVRFSANARALGTAQLAANAAHSHSYSTSWGSNFPGGETIVSGATSVGATTNGQKFTATIGTAGGTETRGQNVTTPLFIGL